MRPANNNEKRANNDEKRAPYADTVIPPELLHQELERLRRREVSFTVAWPIAVSRALRDEPMHTTLFWRRTWLEQKSCWLLSYSRVRWPAAPEPLFVPPYVGHHTEHDSATIVA